MEKQSVKQRIILYQREKKLRPVDITNALCVTKGMLAENKSADFGANKVAKLLEFFPDLSAEWLMRGEGAMLRTPEEQKHYDYQHLFTPNESTVAAESEVDYKVTETTPEVITRLIAIIEDQQRTINALVNK